MVGQQALHRLLETLAAEPLEKRNGIPASLVRVAKPRASIPDAEAVHLLGGMIPADLSDLVSGAPAGPADPSLWQYAFLCL